LRIAQPKLSHAAEMLDDIGQRLRAPIVEIGRMLPESP
jgi:hypothetical protein